MRSNGEQWRQPTPNPIGFLFTGLAAVKCLSSRLFTAVRSVIRLPVHRRPGDSPYTEITSDIRFPMSGKGSFGCRARGRRSSSSRDRFWSVHEGDEYLCRTNTIGRMTSACPSNWRPEVG